MNEILTLSKRLWSQTDKKQRFTFYLILSLSVISSALEVITVSSIIPFVNFILSPENAFQYLEKFPILQSFLDDASLKEMLLPFAIFYITLFVFSGVLRVFLIKLQLKYSFNLGQVIGSKIFNFLLHMPYEKHLSDKSSDSINFLFNKVNVLIKSAIFPIISIITSTILLLTIFLTLIYLSPFFSAAVLIGSVFAYFIFYVKNKKILKENGAKLSFESSRLIKLIQEALMGIRNIIIDSSQYFVLDDFKRIDSLLREAQYKNTFIAMYPKYIVESVALLLILTLSLYTSFNSQYNLNASTETFTMLAVLAVAAQRLIPYVQQIYNSFSLVQGDFASIVSILDLLDKCKMNTKQLNSKIEFKKKILLSNIYFKYETSKSMILNDIQLQIREGEWIAIFGPSGSGKSTLIDILLGLLKPDKGKFFIDGKEITPKNIKHWQSQIGHVPQNVFISDSSIANNIAMGSQHSEIDMNRIIYCAKIVELHDFFESLEFGYNSNVGENGSYLSGGQKQRIGIARALYKNCKILILDEPTSSLDEKMQKKIMENLKFQGVRSTVILITHNRLNAKFCDKIYKMRNGILSQIQ
jgi:ABC-type multidrug transport system fused ATPase/permease subunit